MKNKRNVEESLHSMKKKCLLYRDLFQRKEEDYVSQLRELSPVGHVCDIIFINITSSFDY